MSEQKRRGRPPKSQSAEGADAIIPVIEAREVAASVEAFLAPLGNATRTLDPAPFAQAFAKKVWDAQSPDEPRSWRLERVAEAMRNKGLSMEGIVL